MKPLAFVLLVLVGSMLITSMPSQIFADPQLDSLLRIANQARDNIKIRLSQLESVPDEIAKLYEQGSAETDALAQSVTQEDTASSRQHFLSAMRLFKEASDKISSSTPTIGGDPLPTSDTSRLKNTIARMEKDAQRLKVVAAKNNIEIDFSEFDKLMQIARHNLEAGNTDDVIKTLEIAKQFLTDVYNSISAAAKQKSSDRAKEFATKQIERLDKLIAQARDLGISQDIISTLEALKAKLQQTSDASRIATEMKDINTIQEKLNASQVNRVNALVHQIGSKIDRLEIDVQDDDSRAKIANTKDMFVELKQLVSDGKLEEAIRMIQSIDEILNSIEIRSAATTNETSKALQASDNATKVTAKPDPKIERIKVKIQNLEEQVNSLSEKASGNDVAAQWFKRALSLIDDAKIQLEKSPEKAMRTLNEVEKIIRMIQRIV
ncbi:MAG: hypothetical protein ACREAF_04390 [Nitrosopumilaceae archaeon]